MAKRHFFISFIIATVLFAIIGCKTMEQTKTPHFELRVNCGATESYTDKAGNRWLPDQYMGKGTNWGAVYGMTVKRRNLTIAGTDVPDIYLTERYSMDAYEFIVPNGKYTIRLHFAETFEGIMAGEERIFSVTINSKTVLKDLDLFKQAGFAKPFVKEFKGVSAKKGKLTVGFIPNVENPEINGIEIFSE